MRRDWKSVAARGMMWFLALLVALVAARYFLSPVPWLYHMQVLALARHPFWIRLHIAGGILALTLGLFQFVGSLRAARPRLHRILGRVYVAAVLVGGAAGLRLSPDTPRFVADALNESKGFDLSLVGLSPSVLGYGPSSTYSPSQFFLVMLGFAALALAWLVTTAAALLRARQRRFDRHRAWMTRSYSLTFAAVTVRLVGLPFLVLTRDPVAAITCTFWSWLLNLAVAEWLIRRQAAIAVRAAVASS